MAKLMTFTLATVVCLATSALLPNRTEAVHSSRADAQLATNGAFRDGLYVGRLAAESGRAARPLVGRWSTYSDRATFVLGYTRGYQEALELVASSKHK